MHINIQPQNLQLPESLCSSVFSTIAFTPQQQLIYTISQILDELIIAGELQESSKKSVLRVVRGTFLFSFPHALPHHSPNISFPFVSGHAVGRC